MKVPRQCCEHRRGCAEPDWTRDDVSDSMPGSKACPKCGETKPLDQFHVDSRRSDGRSTHCGQCRSEARKAAYQERLDQERRRARDYYAANRTQRLDYGARRRGDPAIRARRAAVEREHYGSDPAYRASRMGLRKRHGGMSEYQRMWEEQGGRCYLCGQSMEGAPKRFIHVDHDHSCCPAGPKGSKSCPACRRGLVHMACNAIIGLARENPDLLRVIADNLSAADVLTKARIAAKSAM